ncbi:MAG: hypothetical protein L3J69_10140 [Desulfobacula sp.]|nr:hypothetical protein [Desulfobacula sp.]
MASKRLRQLFVNLIGFAAAVIFLASLMGCGEGLPKGIKEQAKSIPGKIKAANKKNDQEQQKYKKLSSSADFKAVERFANKENWTNNFTRAKETLDRAKNLFDTQLDPLISKNKPESVPLVQQQIQRIKEVIGEAESLSRYPLSRFGMIKNTIGNAKKHHADANIHEQEITQIVQQFKAAPLEKTLADFPDNTSQINKRFAPFLELERLSKDDINVVRAEYKKHTSGADADYAAFTDSSLALTSNLEKIQILKAKFAKEIKQLYSSYTKILKDMKTSYQVTIKRESWDENSDYYNPGFATFQREVDLETYEAITNDNIDSIAKITAGFGRSRLSTSIGNYWKNLSINPTEQWPGRNHNAASFWVEDSKETYFHKYILEENGQTSETGWEKVDESFYNENIEHLGMAILAKPYGIFEQDRMVQATPPGMAYVGNSKYGKWQKDNSGNQFWAWYGRYALFSNLFFFPPYQYSYRSWNGWNNNYRNKKPYFGKTKKGFQKFGTNGTFVKKSPKFQSTTFAKSGGFKTQTASVRGAGANLRGGGPKNKGK